MAASRARELTIGTFLLLLLAARVALSSGGAAAQRGTVAAHASIAPASLKVMLFQTSSDLLCPCTRVIQPPPLHEPPFRVVIATPTANGTYPVILFKHGFLLANCFYTQLFQSVASSGYIIVAPQALSVDTNTTEEIEETARVANWASSSLATVLNAAMSSSAVLPNISKLVMAGHSRGGKIAFALALGLSSIEIPSFSALVTLDPVDGTSYDSILVPPIIASGCNHTRNQLSIPILIVGTEYGSETGIMGMQPCAPACCSHMAYFECSSSIMILLVPVPSQGHLDFLDDSQIWTSALCKSGDSKAALRTLSTELMLAFLEKAFEGEIEGMHSLIENSKSTSIIVK